MSTQQSNTVVMLEDVRIAFAHGLWQATTVQGSQGRPAFSASFLFPRDHKSVQTLVNAMVHAARSKWGPQGDAVYQALMAGGRICLRDGNAKPDIAGYPGNLFVSARTPTMPLVIDQNRQPLTQASGKPYSGCYVNASIAIWAQQNQHGRRINAQLRGVQFVRDGEPLAGGSPASADEFGEVESSAMAANEFGAMFAPGAQAQGQQAPATQAMTQQGYAGVPQQAQFPQAPAPMTQPAQSQDFAALLGTGQF